jgi:DNA polymerase III alpha subunit (gram-positive type)
MEQIVPVEAQRIIEQTMQKTYDGYIVSSQDAYTNAGEDLKSIKSKAKELNDLRMSLTRPLDESKKRIMEFFNKPIDFLTKAESSVKSAMLKFQQEQERIRREEERRLAEIQRQKAEELQRQAREAEERAAKLKTDKAKESAAAKAEELRTQAAVVESIAPVVESKFEQAAGISTREVWKFRIVDATKIPREYLIPDENYIGEMVRVTKGKKQIDGIEIYTETVIYARR